MTDTMIERVARIVDPMAFDDFEGLRDYILGRGRSLDDALSGAEYMHGARRTRAFETAKRVIEAMRKPTDEMADAMNGNNFGKPFGAAYTAAIDAALQETKA